MYLWSDDLNARWMYLKACTLWEDLWEDLARIPQEPFRLNHFEQPQLLCAISLSLSQVLSHSNNAPETMTGPAL